MSDSLKRLHDLANTYLDLDLEIEEEEKRLAALKKERHRIISVAMPEIMMEADVSTLSSGGRVYSLETFISGGGGPRTRTSAGTPWSIWKGSEPKD